MTCMGATDARMIGVARFALALSLLTSTAVVAKVLALEDLVKVAKVEWQWMSRYRCATECV